MGTNSIIRNVHELLEIQTFNRTKYTSDENGPFVHHILKLLPSIIASTASILESLLAVEPRYGYRLVHVPNEL